MANMVEVIKKAATDAVVNAMPAGVYFGTVQSVNPLSISLEQKLTLDSRFLVLSSLVSDFTVNMSVDSSTGTDTYTHTHGYSDTDDTGEENSRVTDPETYVHSHTYSGTHAYTVHLGLQAGERVVLVRAQGGQQYIVLDRVR